MFFCEGRVGGGGGRCWVQLFGCFGLGFRRVRFATGSVMSGWGQRDIS